MRNDENSKFILSKNKLEFEQMKQKTRICDSQKRRNLIGGSLEKLSLRQKPASKKYPDKLVIKFYYRDDVSY